MTTTRSRKQHLLSLASIVIAGGLALTAFFVVAPHRLTTNQTMISFEENWRTTLPQGWGFFTRNPREDTVALYVDKPGSGWSESSFGRPTDVGNWFGWDRSSRASEYVISAVLNKQPSGWMECDSRQSNIECIESYRKTEDVEAVDIHADRLEDSSSVALVAEKPEPMDYFGLDYQTERNVLVVDIGGT